MQEVAHHDVSEGHIAQALDDVDGRVFGRWHSMRYGSFRLNRLREMADELLDHVAARALTESGLDEASRLALVRLRNARWA